MTEHLTDVDQLPAALRKFDEECQGWTEYGCGYGLELLIPAADEIERLQDRVAELERIARAARAVVAYDWSDNDEDAAAAIDRLCEAVGPWLERRRSETTGDGAK